MEPPQAVDSLEIITVRNGPGAAAALVEEVQVRWSCPSGDCAFTRGFFRMAGLFFTRYEPVPADPPAEPRAHAFAIRLRTEGCPHALYFQDEYCCTGNNGEYWMDRACHPHKGGDPFR